MSQKDSRGTTCGATTFKTTVVCLLLCMSVHQVSGAYRFPEMKDSIQRIMDYYKMSSDDKYNNQAVIPREAMKTNNSERNMVYMAGVLEEYEKLIDHMLKQLPTPSPPVAGAKPGLATGSPGSTGSDAAPDVRQSLISILEKVQDLKKTYYKEQVKLLHDLQGLKHIKVDNVKVQTKALTELMLLFEEASNLPMIRMRRRRRQTKIKSHRRG